MVMHLTILDCQLAADKEDIVRGDAQLLENGS